MIAHSKEQSSKRIAPPGKKSQKPLSDGIVKKSPRQPIVTKVSPTVASVKRTPKQKTSVSSFLKRLDTSHKDDLRYTAGLMGRLWQPLLFAVLLAIIAVSGLQLFGKYQYVRGLRDIAKSQYNATQERQTSLMHTLDMLDTRSGQERVLREHFHVVKEGEEIVVLIPDEVRTAKSPDSQ